MAETSKQPTVVLASAAQMLSDSPEPPFTIQGWSESKFQRDGMFSRITNEVFKKESLDRKLDRRHITGKCLFTPQQP